MKRMLALILALCLCLPLTALAQEEDWVAQESLRLTGLVKTLSGSQEWRALMGGNGEIGQLLDGFAATAQAEEAARYAVSAAQADSLMATGDAVLPETLLPLARQRTVSSIVTRLGSTLGAAHIAAQSIAMASECLPLPEAWEGDNLLVLVACGEEWSALVTLMDLGTGVLSEQATFLHMSAAEAAALLEEMGLEQQ